MNERKSTKGDTLMMELGIELGIKNKQADRTQGHKALQHMKGETGEVPRTVNCGKDNPGSALRWMVY